MERIKVTVAANITYSNMTYNTKLSLEYEHTGAQYYKSETHYTENREIAERWKDEGEIVKELPGYYFIKRMAIQTLNAKGETDFWYINNPGDQYTINKVSKYAKKIHSLLSSNINPFLNQ